MLHLFSDILTIVGTVAFEILVTIAAMIFVGGFGAWFMTRLTAAIYQGHDSDLQSIPATILGFLAGGAIGAAISVCTYLADNSTGTVITHTLGATIFLLLVGELVIKLVKALLARKPRQ